MIDHLRMLARYNRIANERIYENCPQLDVAECRRERQGSFGSIHGLLNHILLSDQIWMLRFQGGGKMTPPVDSILFESFPELRSARAKEDADIEEFFPKLDGDFLRRSFLYTNNQGKQYAQTYVQSGNIVFKTDERDIGRLGKRLEVTIQKTFGFRPAVILRTAAELRTAVAKNPFAKRRELEPNKLLVLFRADDPGGAAREIVGR